MPRLANDAVKFVMPNLAVTPHLRVATKSNVSDYVCLLWVISEHFADVCPLYRRKRQLSGEGPRR
jgi:hypothetical protein